MGTVVKEKELQELLADVKIIWIQNEANGKHLKRTVGIRRYKLVDVFHTDREIKTKGKEILPSKGKPPSTKSSSGYSPGKTIIAPIFLFAISKDARTIVWTLSSDTKAFENFILLPEATHLKNFRISGWKTKTKIAIKNVRSGWKSWWVRFKLKIFAKKSIPKSTTIELKTKNERVCFMKIKTRLEASKCPIHKW